MKQIVTMKETLLPLDCIEVLEDELMFILGGAAANVGGAGCGCGCANGTGCGCGCGCDIGDPPITNP